MKILTSMHKSLLSSVLLSLAASVCAQTPQGMPSPEEMKAMMEQMQQEMNKLTPEQRKLLEDARQQMPQQAAPGADDDEITAPKANAARNATLAKSVLSGAQLKAHVVALQPKITKALSATARSRAQQIESALAKEPDALRKLRAAANGLAAWGAWPEAVYLMGKVALASGSAEDLNNLAAFLTMEGVPEAAMPILVTLNARYPNNATLLNNLGLAWFELGDSKEAERVLTLAVRRYPSHPQANVTISRIQEARGDKQAAQASMRAAIRGGFSEDKAQRLAKLGDKPSHDDVRWTLPMPQDALGLSRFVAPAYPTSFAQLPVLTPIWRSFKADINAERERLSSQSAKLAANRNAASKAWIKEAYFRGPLSAKAERLVKLELADSKRETDRLTTQWRAAQQIEEQARKTMEQRLDAINAEGEKKYANYPGGYDRKFSCSQLVPTIDKYIETSNPPLEKAGNELLEFSRRQINELAYLDQFRMTDLSYEIAKLDYKIKFLDALLQANHHSAAQLGGTYDALLHGYWNACGRDNGKKPGKGKLADFDDIHCEYISTLNLGVGTITTRCNKMETKFDAPFVPVAAKWTEDLNKDRLLSASAEVQIEAVTVGAHGEFDDKGLASGGVSVGAKANIGPDKDTGNIVAGGEKIGAGPLEIGVSVKGTVGVEFDRTGITDVRIEASAGSSASSTIGKTDAGGASSQVSTNVTSSWSWNGGASASASGNFDRSVF
ncbi:MAG: hypothetical protein GC149_15085 [Gammaproteobacteria bacterium]|nr:hypothetical protein [Gammaproteobacteria bacterium]